MDMADRYGSDFLRWLCSADLFNEDAISLGSFDSNILACRSSASLCSVTSADHFFFDFACVVAIFKYLFVLDTMVPGNGFGLFFFYGAYFAAAFYIAAVYLVHIFRQCRAAHTLHYVFLAQQCAFQVLVNKLAI